MRCWPLARTRPYCPATCGCLGAAGLTSGLRSLVTRFGFWKHAYTTSRAKTGCWFSWTKRAPALIGSACGAPAVRKRLAGCGHWPQGCCQCHAGEPARYCRASSAHTYQSGCLLYAFRRLMIASLQRHCKLSGERYAATSSPSRRNCMPALSLGDFACGKSAREARTTCCWIITSGKRSKVGGVYRYERPAQGSLPST